MQAVQERQGLKVSCIEEIVFRLGYIDAKQLEKLAGELMKNGYGQYLMDVLEESEKENKSNDIKTH